MKRKFLPFLILVNGFAYSQYSNYYNVNSNVNVNANINHNVSGNIYEHKTITTIDYGALKLANAEYEKNRLEQQKFANERERQIAIEISNDPLKAYDYGNWFTISSKDKMWKQNKAWKESLKNAKDATGLKEFGVDYLFPSSQIFTMLNIYQLQNVNSDGVKTDIIFILPFYNKNNVKVDKEAEFEKVIIGEVEQPDDENKIRKVFLHKKELNRATVYGSKGYRETYAWEDKFEVGLTDNYTYNFESLGNGLTVFVKVRYYGNKSEIDFEKLEGRRFYFKSLIEKIVSTARVSDLKY